MITLTVPLEVNFDEEKIRNIVEEYIEEHDVVQVTRCKNCKHYRTGGEQFPDLKYCEKADIQHIWEDFFCAYGEEK